MKKSVNKNKQKKVPNTKPKNRRWIIVGGLAIIGLVIVWGSFSTYFAYQDSKEATAIAQDRQKFEDAKRTVETITERFRDADADVEWALESSCARAHVKFELGDATCGIYSGANIVLTSNKQASQAIDKYESILAKSDDLLQITTKTQFFPSNFPNNKEPGSAGSTYVDIRTGMMCGSLYEINAEQQIQQEEVNQPLLMLRFNCRSGALDTHFPRSDI